MSATTRQPTQGHAASAWRRQFLLVVWVGLMTTATATFRSAPGTTIFGVLCGMLVIGAFAYQRGLRDARVNLHKLSADARAWHSEWYVPGTTAFEDELNRLSAERNHHTQRATRTFGELMRLAAYGALLVLINGTVSLIILGLFAGLTVATLTVMSLATGAFMYMSGRRSAVREFKQDFSGAPKDDAGESEA